MAVSNEQRADRAAVEAQAAEERYHRNLEQVKQDHEQQMSEVLAELQDSKQQLQHQLSQFVNVRPRRPPNVSTFTTNL